MNAMFSPPNGRLRRERRRRTGFRFGGLREASTLQASLRDRICTQDQDHAAIFASSPILKTNRRTGHISVDSRRPGVLPCGLPAAVYRAASRPPGWPGQISVHEWLTFSLKYPAAGGLIHCLSFFYAQNFRMNPNSIPLGLMPRGLPRVSCWRDAPVSSVNSYHGSPRSHDRPADPPKNNRPTAPFHRLLCQLS